MDFMQSLQQIAVERDLPIEELRAELEEALGVAYKRFRGVEDDVVIRLDAKSKTGAWIEKEVVGEVIDPTLQISLEAAKNRKADVEIGDMIPVEIDPVTFGRIGASTVKQVLQQKIHEAERRKMHSEFNERVGEVVSGQVSRREESTVLIQVNRTEVELPKREQVPTDDYRPNERLRVYIVKLEETKRGWTVIASRSHPNLLRKLLELEVPEIADGAVEIKSVAREPGQRSKVAVISHDERIDAIGACVGPRGSRIQTLMDELRPEKIDIVPFSEEPRQYIMNALSPAKVNNIKLNMDEKSAYVIVPDTQLSLAIGRGGQNVRLAARLTDWRIDIRSESQALEEKQGKTAGEAS